MHNIIDTHGYVHAGILIGVCASLKQGNIATGRLDQDVLAKGLRQMNDSVIQLTKAFTAKTS